MRIFAIICNILWLGALGVMLWLGGASAGDPAELVMLLIMGVTPIINILVLKKTKLSGTKISSSLPFLYLKRIKLEQQRKIEELQKQQ